MSIDKKTVQVPLNQVKASNRSLGGILTILVGLGVIAIAASGQEVRIDASIFGGILVLAGVFKLISGSKVSGAKKGEFAISISNEKVIISSHLTGNDAPFIIDTANLISAETDLSEGGTVTLYVKYRTGQMEKAQSMGLDVVLANIDYLVLKNGLNDLAKAKDEEKRREVLHNLSLKVKSF